MSDAGGEEPLTEMERWIVYVGFALIAATMVLGLLQLYKDQQ